MSGKLILARHQESEWNKLGKWTGATNVGLTGYGCCEDLTRKLDLVFTIPHIRRISISPWADVDACAAKLGDRYIFSWKPHPAHLAGRFDPDRVRAYIRHTLAVSSTTVGAGGAGLGGGGAALVRTAARRQTSTDSPPATRPLRVCMPAPLCLRKEQ